MAASAKALAAKQSQQKKANNLFIKIQESGLYDWNPTARALLVTISLLQMKDENAYYPEDAPLDHYNNRIGWCWMSQYRLALRVGCDERTVRRYIARFRKDGVIRVRTWTDDNKTPHAEYQIVEAVIEDNQRPSQRREVTRPPRYKKKRGANLGSFTAKNQPGKPKDDEAVAL